MPCFLKSQHDLLGLVDVRHYTPPEGSFLSKQCHSVQQHVLTSGISVSVVFEEGSDSKPLFQSVNV